MSTRPVHADDHIKATYSNGHKVYREIVIVHSVRVHPTYTSLVFSILPLTTKYVATNVWVSGLVSAYTYGS